MAGLCQIGGIARFDVFAPSSPRKRGSREVGETVGREPRLRGKGGGGGEDCSTLARGKA